MTGIETDLGLRRLPVVVAHRVTEPPPIILDLIVQRNDGWYQVGLTTWLLAKFCSDACRQRAHRSRLAVTTPCPAREVTIPGPCDPERKRAQNRGEEAPPCRAGGRVPRGSVAEVVIGDCRLGLVCERQP